MKTIRSVFKIGKGPSSSHTVGPFNAAQIIKKRFPDADSFEVTLYGSLAATGSGHATGKAITSVLPSAVVFPNLEEKNIPHPNTMLFIAKKSGQEIGSVRIMSIGGGSLEIEGEPSQDTVERYPQKNFSEIMETCQNQNKSLVQFIYDMEGEDLRDDLTTIWHAMESCVERGLKAEGVLPGKLGLQRKANMLYHMICYNESADITMNRLISAYAYAVSEENAAENVVVTAPTCGSCGVIPAVFYYMQHQKGFPECEIVDALAVCGLIGNVIRTNASISGAECGCQAEIGSACSMAAGGLAALQHLNSEQIEYAAEIAMEHHLGLTCDPVMGLVQIPCIERNAVAAMRAVNVVDIARFLYKTRIISFDDVLDTMYRTGKDLSEKYRETAHGGLAALYPLK